jgi:hypothetical protein
MFMREVIVIDTDSLTTEEEKHSLNAFIKFAGISDNFAYYYYKPDCEFIHTMFPSFGDFLTRMNINECYIAL